MFLKFAKFVVACVAVATLFFVSGCESPEVPHLALQSQPFEVVIQDNAEYGVFEEKIKYEAQRVLIDSGARVLSGAGAEFVLEIKIISNNYHTIQHDFVSVGIEVKRRSSGEVLESMVVDYVSGNDPYDRLQSQFYVSQFFQDLQARPPGL